MCTLSASAALPPLRARLALCTLPALLAGGPCSALDALAARIPLWPDISLRPLLA